MDIADLVTRLNGSRYSEYGLCARGIFVAKHPEKVELNVFQ